LCAPTASAQSKRALLIGIDTYEPHGRPIPNVIADRLEGASRFDLPTWPDLDGAVNDVKAMQALLTSPKFGFANDAQHMHVLLQESGTREAILAAMRRYLVDEPARGDIVVFYYAGHGSLRYNSKSEKRASHLDNTIVPADAYTGAFDVRDREIARIFNAALDKGVILTAIFDSCHSGTIARGVPLGGTGKIRSLPYDPRDIAQGPDMKDGKEVVAPEDRKENAAIVFSATQPDELAHESVYADEPHGAFTAALIEALKVLPSNTPAKDVYKRVKVVMEGMGLAGQQPMLDGSQEREDHPLLGTESAGGTDKKLRVAVVAADGENIELDGGEADGFGPGSEFVQLHAGSEAPAARIRVQKLDGLTRSSAKVIDAGVTEIRAGDLFEIDTWVPSQRKSLEVWVPDAAPSADELKSIVDVANTLRASPNVTWISDPAQQAPTHVLWWNGSQWVVSRAGSADTISVGANLDAETVAGALRGKDIRLFVDIPPSHGIAQQLRSMAAGSTVAFADSSASALYVLAGTLNGSDVRYSWFLRTAIEEGFTRSSSDSNAACSVDSPYPLRTNWVASQQTHGQSDVASGLFDLAKRLSKAQAWLSLPNPAGGVEAFPYQLALKSVSTGAEITEGPVHENDNYDLVLKSAHRLSSPVAQRWIYVLDIDCQGAGTLLFPYSGGENKFPINPNEPSGEIALPMGGHVRISKPLGLDTYVLLTTSEALPDPSVLNFEGALTRGAGAPSTPLQDLLSIGTATRGAVPTDWSVEYLHILSAPASPKSATVGSKPEASTSK
jgi:hypothetical protein